ncbi:uncharacterized protein N7446_001085 [Penicillium canescens]|uniref:uncharacterized protein n=1 Tax=Penicillium canescens TaxID=5083 RepID=UPI0026DEF171|nr:uncharacterized protein N7446_001085 [Penicillium canescens]KAJ6060234.1 hypothetical protein N7444_002088 [Penicillium canescens]KAJ6078149.1 hypothetical protein N7446_001085 [Penicillium canescens]
MFKCLCDTIILDDFKTALDTLSARWMMRQGMQGVHSLGFLALFRNLSASRLTNGHSQTLEATQPFMRSVLCVALLPLKLGQCGTY